MLYSFVIPHKNSLDLLQRCLDSIPVRSDIEIIVVDDNSMLDNRPMISRWMKKLSILMRNILRARGVLGIMG